MPDDAIDKDLKVCEQTLHIERLSIEEYAWARARQGQTIRRVGSVYWSRIRPFFYRPLLAYDAIATTRPLPPCRIGGYQYVVADPREANSTVNFRIFDNCAAYALAKQPSEYRRMVRLGLGHFDIRRITTADELKEHGYRLYLSFYGRTGYTYMPERVQRDTFDRWADAVFACPKVLVLGAYGEEGLLSVSICYLIGGTLHYSTSFSETGSLKRHVCDALLHAVRDLAAREDGIVRILAGMYSGGIGSDKFDLLRGAKVERRQARYVISPALTDKLLMTLSPESHSKLMGNF
jgi:hypothetical protein